MARKDQNKIIVQAVQATTDVALQQSMMNIDSNYAERQKRVRNIVISNIAENSPGASLTEVVRAKLNEGFRKEDILSTRRLGKTPERGQRARAILCVMRRVDDAVFLTNDGKGRKFPGGVWVNPDLTTNEREALYQKRLARRNKAPPPTNQPPMDQGDRARSDGVAAARPRVPVQQDTVGEEQTISGQITVEAEIHNTDPAAPQPDTAAHNSSNPQAVDGSGEPAR